MKYVVGRFEEGKAPSKAHTIVACSSEKAARIYVVRFYDLQTCIWEEIPIKPVVVARKGKSWVYEIELRCKPIVHADLLQEFSRT